MEKGILGRQMTLCKSTEICHGPTHSEIPSSGTLGTQSVWGEVVGHHVNKRQIRAK